MCSMYLLLGTPANGVLPVVQLVLLVNYHNSSIVDAIY